MMRNKKKKDNYLLESKQKLLLIFRVSLVQDLKNGGKKTSGMSFIYSQE